MVWNGTCSVHGTQCVISVVQDASVYKVVYAGRECCVGLCGEGEKTTFFVLFCFVVEGLICFLLFLFKEKIGGIYLIKVFFLGIFINI